MKARQLRARALADWRGLTEPIPESDTFIMASDIVRKLMKSFGLTERLRSEEVLAAWHEIVGDFFAKNSSPKYLKDGVLYVSVLQPTIHYELDRVWRREILTKLRDRFGARTILEMKFRLG